MQIEKITVGNLETNCYLLSQDNKAIIIDPGDEAEKIIKKINTKVIGIIITHYHFDHIGALEYLKNKYNVPVIDYQNKIVLEPFNYQIIETKGHSDTSITIYFKKDEIMFCGDFIFKGTIGRIDLPTGSMLEMKQSIKNILTYNKEIKLYPGHGEETTLENENDNLTYILNNF